MFFNEPLRIKIDNLYLYSNHKRNKTSHSLLQKCNFFDVSEINTIKKLNNLHKIFLIDCGCNFGFTHFTQHHYLTKMKLYQLKLQKIL